MPCIQTSVIEELLSDSRDSFLVCLEGREAVVGTRSFRTPLGKVSPAHMNGYELPCRASQIKLVSTKDERTDLGSSEAIFDTER